MKDVVVPLKPIFYKRFLILIPDEKLMKMIKLKKKIKFLVAEILQENNTIKTQVYTKSSFLYIGVAIF